MKGKQNHRVLVTKHKIYFCPKQPSLFTFYAVPFSGKIEGVMLNKETLIQINIQSLQLYPSFM